jgi:predicted AAA+ superfamily ATPase
VNCSPTNAAHGAGQFCHFKAFPLDARRGTGHLVGTAHPDPVRLRDLVAYEPERALVLLNTEQF